MNILDRFLNNLTYKSQTIHSAKIRDFINQKNKK